MKTIKIKIINKNLLNYNVLPKQMTPGSAGFDLCACIDYPIILRPSETNLISTGIAIHINDVKIAGIILPRSGIGHKHGIILSNTIGLIDSDYQGEILVSLWNRGNKIFNINPGNRIAQLIFIPIIPIQFLLVSSFYPSIRGAQGFGHSTLKHK